MTTEAIEEIDHRDALAILAEQIAIRDPKHRVKADALAQLLHEVIEGPNEASVEIRTLLMARLAHLQVVTQARRKLAAARRGVARSADEVLTTEEAADLLGCSRPHVAMLIDAGALKGASKTPGGHRRVPKGSVLALKKEREDQGRRSGADYRKAARETGMYDVPEAEWVRGG